MRKNKSIKSLLLSYSGKFSSMSYSGLSRVSRGFKWIIGTSPRMTIKNVCTRITPALLSYLGKFSSKSYSCNFSSKSYSCLTRVSMDPRNKSEDDNKGCASEDDCSECALEDDFALKLSLQGGSFLLSSLRGDNRGQAIFKLEKRGLICRCLDVFLRKRGMTFICCLLSSTAYAECTPTPDCASIGYTETSCETTSLKCPFDTSKLYCLPCDSSFKYDCNGDNMTGSVGSACNGKYASCECASGTIFENGSCVCDTSCTVGAIYYSDKTCSACLVSGKTAIGVVVKDNELIVALTVSDMVWSGAYTDTSLTNYSSVSDVITDYNGKSNTEVIVAAYPSNTSSNNVAVYCNSYSTAGTSAGDWYLPAAGELYSYVYSNYNAVKASWDKVETSFMDSFFWSSSERDSHIAWGVWVDWGEVEYRDKVRMTSGSVTCFLAIN